MSNRVFCTVMGVATLACLSLISLTIAEEMNLACPRCNCPNGVCYQQVISHVCKMVEVRTPIKKTVYECKEIPYCEHALPALIGRCDCCCPQCKSCPKYKKVLIKKEIVCGEKCEYKCIPEEVVTVVAVPCSQCGHCNHGPCATGNGVPGTAPPAIQQPAPAVASPPTPVVDPAAQTKPIRVKSPEIVIADPFQVR